jgi:hypothetical protein
MFEQTEVFPLHPKSDIFFAESYDAVPPQTPIMNASFRFSK